MTRSIFALVLILTVFLGLSTAVQAKRKLPALKSAPAVKSTSSNVTVKVKFRSDRKGVVLNLGNLSAASGVSYDLIYDTRGTTQNAGGAIKISGDTNTAEVIFGTCSAGVWSKLLAITSALVFRVISVTSSGRSPTRAIIKW